jgi:hypothetical protein
MSKTYTVKTVLSVPMILKNGMIDETIAMNFDSKCLAQEHCDELNAKIKQVDDLTTMLTHALGSDTNVRQAVQKLQDEGELALTLI